MEDFGRGKQSRETPISTSATKTCLLSFGWAVGVTLSRPTIREYICRWFYTIQAEQEVIPSTYMESQDDVPA